MKNYIQASEIVVGSKLKASLQKEPLIVKQVLTNDKSNFITFDFESGYPQTFRKTDVIQLYNEAKLLFINNVWVLKNVNNLTIDTSENFDFIETYAKVLGFTVTEIKN